MHCLPKSCRGIQVWIQTECTTVNSVWFLQRWNIGSKSSWVLRHAVNQVMGIWRKASLWHICMTIDSTVAEFSSKQKSPLSRSQYFPQNSATIALDSFDLALVSSYPQRALTCSSMKLFPGKHGYLKIVIPNSEGRQTKERSCLLRS